MSESGALIAPGVETLPRDGAAVPARVEQSAAEDLHHRVLAAYVRLGEGDPSELVEILDTEVEWCAPGAIEVGRDAVVRRLSAVTPGDVELIGVRRGDRMLTLEFTRPWWNAMNGPTYAVRSIFGIRGEQLVFVDDGLVTRIESRQRVPPDLG